MGNRPSLAYITVTIIAAVLGVVGVYLPWVRKRPVGYTDGQPYYTSEYVTGLEAGIRGIDPFVIVPLVAVITVVVLARYRTWRPDTALVGAGGLLLVVFGNIFHNYWSVERYAVEPGLYLLLSSGLILVLVGTGTVLKRRVSPHTDESRDSKIS